MWGTRRASSELVDRELSGITLSETRSGGIIGDDTFAACSRAIEYFFYSRSAREVRATPSAGAIGGAMNRGAGRGVVEFKGDRDERGRHHAVRPSGDL